MNYLLYNPLANGRHGEVGRDEALAYLQDKFENIKVKNVLELSRKLEAYMDSINEDDNIFFVGGDGTLNHIANVLAGRKCPCNVYFFKAGTGNDFFNDVLPNPEDKLLKVNSYIESLPTINVNGESLLFVNGVGIGIDGQICEIGEELKAKTTQKVNYTAIAIKLLLGKFKRMDIKVNIDGKEMEFKKVWLATVMHGKFLGGGMMLTPDQVRNSGELTLSVIHGSGRFKTLMLFLQIFKGLHIKKFPKNCEVFKGKHIEVISTTPRPIQIDGEVVKDVTKYEAIIK